MSGIRVKEKPVLDLPTRRRRAPPASLATRYLRAALDAGASVTELVIEPDGCFRILFGVHVPKVSTPDNEFDAWLSKKGARP